VLIYISFKPSNYPWDQWTKSPKKQSKGVRFC